MTSARPGAKIDEFDMLQRRIELRRQNHAGTMRQAGQQRRRLAQHIFNAAGRFGRGDLGVDAGPLVGCHSADFQQASTKNRKPCFGRHAAGTGMGRKDEPGVLKVHHDIADRGRRQVGRQDARDGARTDGLAGFQIGIDKPAEDLARALVETGEPGGAVVLKGLGGMTLMGPI